MGHFHDNQIHLEVCTCCQLKTTTDIKLLLMRLARNWDVKNLDFPGIYFTTTEGNTLRELRGVLVQEVEQDEEDEELNEECNCDLREGAVINFHFLCK